MPSWSCNGTWILVCLSIIANAQAQDVNDDGMFDCADVDLIGAAVRTQSDDLSFDFDNDGTVDHHDYREAFNLAGFSDADINFDGGVDRLDYHPFGLHWQRSVTSFCQGDLNYDGFVDAQDSGNMGINWQLGAVLDNSPAATVNFPEIPSRLAAWKSGQFVFAESGPFELVATPKRAPDGLLTTVVGVRTKDRAHRISTFDHIRVSGEAHQVWIPSVFGPVPSPTGMPANLLDSAPGLSLWNEADTQVLIRDWQIGVGAGQGFAGIYETNDQKSRVQIDPLPAPPVPAADGIGVLQMAQTTDIFSLRSDNQTNYIELYQFVTPADDGNESEGVFFTLGVQGGDADGEPLPFHDVFGIDAPLQVPFFSQPCDFDGDGFCNQEDLDRLLTAVADGIEDPDLNLDSSDPPLITQADVDAWHYNSDPTPGDTDYDGDVDTSDLNNLARNWLRRGTVLRWEDGDFDSTGTVDVIDLNLLGINWQHGVEPMRAAVPEPGLWTLSLGGLVYLVLRRRASHHRITVSLDGPGGIRLEDRI